jgi:hypothetical protein
MMSLLLDGVFGTILTPEDVTPSELVCQETNPSKTSNTKDDRERKV